MSRSVLLTDGSEVTRYTSDQSFDFEYKPGSIMSLPHTTALELATAILRLEHGND